MSENETRPAPERKPSIWDEGILRAGVGVILFLVIVFVCVVLILVACGVTLWLCFQECN